MRVVCFVLTAVCAAGLAPVCALGQATMLGPTPYLCASDSPFNTVSGFAYFYRETFEDHLFNTPGAVADVGFVTSTVFAGLHDSVDCDDGSIDGSGSAGDSYFSYSAITITFIPGPLGGYPTHAGLAWTDGSGTITFTATDPSDVLLGTVTGMHADGSYDGATAEDRFYGVINTAGIKSMTIGNAGGALEIDHLQYGRLGPLCSADWDGNGAVQPADVSLFVSQWFTSLQSGTLIGDFDGNGQVQPADVSLFVARWFAAVAGGGC